MTLYLLSLLSIVIITSNHAIPTRNLLRSSIYIAFYIVFIFIIAEEGVRDAKTSFCIFIPLLAVFIYLCEFCLRECMSASAIGISYIMFLSMLLVIIWDTPRVYANSLPIFFFLQSILPFFIVMLFSSTHCFEVVLSEYEELENSLEGFFDIYVKVAGIVIAIVRIFPSAREGGQSSSHEMPQDKQGRIETFRAGLTRHWLLALILAFMSYALFKSPVLLPRVSKMVIGYVALLFISATLSSILSVFLESVRGYTTIRFLLYLFPLILMYSSASQALIVASSPNTEGVYSLLTTEVLLSHFAIFPVITFPPERMPKARVSPPSATKGN